jgi:hypothetical protein
MCSSITTHPDGIAIERLGLEITELASHIHAATCRWLGLVAEFDQRGGWAQWGCRSCAAFLSWRCAIAPGAAREHVRVARRLEELPLIRAAFSEGRLSYSKVRALTRVGSVEQEAGLLDLARHSTAAQLERMVRAYRGVTQSERAAAGRPPRYVTWEHGDDGSLHLRACLPAEEGALVLAALEAGLTQQRRDTKTTSAAAGVSAETPVDPRGLPGKVPDREHDVPAETPDDVHDVPAETPDALDEIPAETVPSLSERRADVLIAMADALLEADQSRRTGGDRFQVVVHVDTATLATHDGHGLSELAEGAPLARETARRLACDAAIVPLLERDGRPLSLGRKTRSVLAPLRRALASRDRGCRFPGCTNHSAVEAHHIEHWAHGGSTSLENLVQLCRFHHRLLHEGGYSVERAGTELVFRRPDGRPGRLQEATDSVRETGLRLTRIGELVAGVAVEVRRPSGGSLDPAGFDQLA